jgi:predicted TIM-barrel fold metal-dependent hydrolase
MPEEALEPDLPICDPHHHLWDYPDSRYLVDEFLDDLNGGHNITDTVYVECRHGWHTDGPEAMRPVGETMYVERLIADRQTDAGTARVARGIVGFADLALGAAVRPVLAAHLAASHRFRGIRHMTAWDPSDRIHNAQTNPTRALLQDAKFREGFACLADLGLSFDAWVFHPQIPEVTDLARAFPDTTIVLNHVGGPLGIGPYANQREEIFGHWQVNIAELARCPNVVVKLGGLTMSLSGFGWHKRETPPDSGELADAMGPYYRTCIELFGAQRCMFESNFPVDRVSCSYTVLWNAFKRLSRDYSDAERAALFHGTAAKVYRLE